MIESETEIYSTPLSVNLTDRQIRNFWRKVQKLSENECWNWTASKDGNGYGKLGTSSMGKTRMWAAHRLSFLIKNGRLNECLGVLHSCDNPLCVNPKHLRQGTHVENMEDAKLRGRMASGENHGLRKHPERAARGDRHSSKTHPERVARGSSVGGAKLTDELVLRIRADYIPGKFGCRRLGRKYGIGFRHANQIVSRKIWSHI